MEVSFDMKCRELKVGYSAVSGILRCVPSFEFSVEIPEKVSICIEEMGVRIITISSEQPVTVNRLYDLLIDLERLLNIFDGAFVKLDKIEISGEEQDSTYASLAAHLKVQRLCYFNPAKCPSVLADRILNYEDVLTSELLKNWQQLLGDLGVVNQMYLYATSDCGLTNDVKCAFLVELSESMIEVIGEEKIHTSGLMDNKGNFILKPCLRTIINAYGESVFEREIQYDLEKILSCLVNTRVNIMHVKLHQKKPKLDGRESILYTIKMSYLYRIVVLSKLNIDESIYEEKLRNRIRFLDGWNNIQKMLFIRLNNTVGAN